MSDSIGPQYEEQLRRLRQGTIPVQLSRPCTLEDGIVPRSQLDEPRLRAAFERARGDGRISQMVPASGAATRMFKDLLAAQSELGQGRSPEGPAETALSQLEAQIHSFAFTESFAATLESHGLPGVDTIFQKQPADGLRVLLGDSGLGLANLPKGLIPFHRYEGGSRQPIEEHLRDALELSVDSNGVARVHFTLPEEALDFARAELDQAARRQATDGVRFDISTSVQDKNTDTLALSEQGEAVRERDGSLHTRPAGHGALLSNLQALGGDIVCLKNIDNVVPEHLKAGANGHRKLLAGLVVDLQATMHGFMDQLENGACGQAELESMLTFARDRLDAPDAPESAQDAAHAAAYLLNRFNRPVRVCGVVPSTGEPGGGPFWTGDSRFPLQIVESASVDLSDDEQASIWNSSTHFNPVDLVCGIRNHRGEPFDLPAYVDHDAAFISSKSFNGEPIKALELPGLWNGSMAHWNTVFVEVPIESFNPVKTVFDLLRPAHQPT